MQQGTLQIGDGTQTSNLLANASGITLGQSAGAGTLRYQLDASFTLAQAVSFANSGSAFIWQGTTATDVMTVNGVLGSDSTLGRLQVNSGSLSLGSGASVKVSSVGLLSTPANTAAAPVGTIVIGSGASLTTKFLGLGDASNTSGIVNQSGGLVTVESGGNGIRIGHWGNGSSPGSVYNLSGGTLDASATSVSVGWDGKGDMTVGGGAGSATFKAGSITIDANGDSATFNDTLTISSNGVVEIGGTLNSGSVNDKVILNGGLLRATASGTWSAPFTLNAATTSSFEASAGVTATVSGVLSGSGNLLQGGSGTIAYTGANTGFTGNLTVNSGTMSGTGSIAGNITVNSAINAGANAAIGSVGTLTLGDASATTTTTTLNGVASFDLNGASTSSGNDLIAINDHLTVGAGGKIGANFYGAAAANGAVYTLMTYAGTLTGAPTLDTAFTSSYRQTFTLDTATAGQIKLAVSGSAANLVWAGDGITNAWNVNGSANWTNGGADKFYQTDSVSFTDAGNNAVPVNLTGNLITPTLTVNSTKNYTFGGTGAIYGGGAFTKSGSGALSVLTDATLGAMNITGGTVSFGNGGTTGGLLGSGTITLATGTTLSFNRSDATSFTRAFASGSAGTLIKDGAGNMTVSGTFQLLPTNLTVNGGTLTLANGSFGGNRLQGNGIVTVNSGGTLLLAAGAAHALGGDNGTMTESVTINSGTLTVNQEQYLNNLTLNGGIINGSSEIRSGGATNWQATGSTASTVAAKVNLVGTANWNVSDVTSSAAEDLTVSGAMSGAGAVNKTGAGTLRISGANNFTSAVTVTNGTLQAANATALGFGGAQGNAALNGSTVNTGAALDIYGVSVNEVITLNGGKLINSNTGTAGTLASGIAGVRVSAVGSGYTSAPTLAFSGGGGSGATATTALSGATLGTVTTTAAGSGYTSAPTVTLTGGAGTGATATAVISSLVLGSGANEVGGDGTLNVNALITGTGGFTKTGNGILNLGTSANNFTGNLAVNGGSLNVAVQGNATTSAFGSASSTRSVTINNGGTVNFNTNNILGNGATALSSLTGFTVNSGGTLATNNYNVLGAVNINGGTVTAIRTGTPSTYQGFEFKGTVTTGGSSQSVITATNGFGHHLAGNITFDVADATAGTDLLVSAGFRNASPDVGGTGGLTKIGAGTMALTASSTYTGATTVSAGTLLVNGALGNTAVSVGLNGTLGGGSSTAGTIAGNVTVDGTLAPGNSAGTLALAGSLLLNSTATLNFELNSLNNALGLGVNDLVSVGNALTLDGTLNVSGPNSFAGVNSGSWTLFTYGSLTDNGLTLGSMPVLDEGLSWELNSGGGQVNVNIIPEPNVSFLGAVGILLILRRRR